MTSPDRARPGPPAPDPSAAPDPPAPAMSGPVGAGPTAPGPSAAPDLPAPGVSGPVGAGPTAPGPSAAPDLPAPGSPPPPSQDPARTHEHSVPHARQVAQASVLEVRGGRARWRQDRLTGEEPMAILAAGPDQAPIEIAVTMRTPGHEAELAVGFLRTEGLIDDVEPATITFGDPGVHARPDDEVTVHLARHFDPSIVAERRFVATASCGICGKASLDEIEVRCSPLPPGPTVAPSILLSLPDRLREAQAAFGLTGGLHAAGLFDRDGRLLALREDVGRHNALDKLVGSERLAGRLPLRDRIVLVSGRASFELVQKAAVAGASILCAISAPSDLAVEAAERLGQTLIGFLRGDGFNVYAHPERLALADEGQVESASR